MEQRIKVNYDESCDRVIYKEFDNDGCIVGLNFMQGNEMDVFKKGYMKNDADLFDYALNHPSIYYSVEKLINIQKDGEHRIDSSISDDVLNKIFWEYASRFETATESLKYLREKCGYRIFMFKDTDVLKRKDTLDKEQCEEVLDEVESMMEDSLKSNLDFVIEALGHDEEN
tara:strand:- start:3332 stop:3844 length:513 start_codon:yes stop_codon:yes gene_type:complete